MHPSKCSLRGDGHSRVAWCMQGGYVSICQYGQVLQGMVLKRRLQSEKGGCYGGMSMHSSKPILAAACMGGGTTPRVDIVDVGPGRLNRRLQLQRTSSDLVSCVAFLPGSDLFAIGVLTGHVMSDSLRLLWLRAYVCHTSGGRGAAVNLC